MCHTTRYTITMIHPFLRRLSSGPLLCDGAMGTLLLAQGVPATHPFDELNLTDFNLIGGIHRDYINAGAEVIETNTFGANRARLLPHGLDAQVRRINQQGVRAARYAREETGEDVLIAGAIGPLGRPHALVRETAAAEIRDIFREQVEGLLEGGVDLLMMETFGDVEELARAVEAARAVTSDVPVVAQLTFADDGQTLAGQSAAEVVACLRGLDIQALGANCNLGPQATLEAIEALAPLASGIPLSAQPNAGLPARVNGRFLYGAGPDYFAAYARHFVEAGVSLVGGCCGTTPLHIQAMRRALDAMRRTEGDAAHPRPYPWSGRRGNGDGDDNARDDRTSWRAALSSGATALSARQEQQTRGQAPPAVAPVAAAVTAVTAVAADKTAPPEPTRLARLFAQGRWTVSVEIRPPRGINPAKALRNVEMLRDEGGVDVVNILDSPMARVRMSALAVAYLIQERLGVETIVHMTSRDRNLMALQSELLGAHAHDVRNILALHGDVGKAGDYPHTSGIWDVDAVGLIEIMTRLNGGEDSSGASIGRRAGFHIGCAVDPTLEWDGVRRRLHEKIAAGAHYVMSQPVYDADLFERFLDYLGPLPVPLLVGVIPLNNARHAEYLHNEVPGIEIPDDIRRRMAEAGENSQAEGIALAREFLARVAPRVQGAYLGPSFDRYEVVGAVIKGLPGR